MADLLRTSYDSLGNRVTFAWDSRPTDADKTWALETFKKEGRLRVVQRLRGRRSCRNGHQQHVDPRAHGFTMQRYR